MPTIRIAYRLVPPPGGGFHLGREGLDQEVSAETLPSDSFFAALIATLVQVQGRDAADAFLAAWPTGDRVGAPPFTLSSLFPCAGQLLLLPMPRLHVNTQKSDDPRQAKVLKKLAYVSPAILTQLLAGQQMDRWLPAANGKSQGLALQDGRVWIDKGEQNLLPAPWQKLSSAELADKRIWKVDRVPRVTIDRISNSSQIFHVGRTTFASECGLWLLTDLDTADQGWFEDLLTYLGDAGIGGERSSGYGMFAWQPIAPPRLPSPQGAPRAMTLARYNPTRAEIAAGVLGPKASYELIDVGGWLASPGKPAQRRKRVRMIESGSVLVAATDITGQLVDVCPEYAQDGAPDHPVYRSGIALTVGVTAKQEGK